MLASKQNKLKFEIKNNDWTTNVVKYVNNEVRKARRLIISLAIAMMTVTFYVTGSSQTLPSSIPLQQQTTVLSNTQEKNVCKCVFL